MRTWLESLMAELLPGWVKAKVLRRQRNSSGTGDGPHAPDVSSSAQTSRRR